ncbi:hypothetical protein [Bradyrhizobium ottawaense]|uniref:Uncharacterized protein n=1 Tax=Bradyrhizobium ottawaense TaxID=931866 RepID=A0ABY0QHG5_9BRAD|nr:hypothetical protein [Bradyrhizobium ottawaense]SDK45453.1 hypothetical protein SAMN05444163_8150 [Bradyrhizobium ottawaense]
MNSSSLLEERTKALGWLTHGGELAAALKGERARHSDVIWQLLVEAVEVIDKTPDNERRWLTSGQRSGGWNMVGMSRNELIEIEKIRLLSAMKPHDGQSKYSPQRNDVDRALGVLEWMRWCNSARLPDRLRRAAISLARGGDQEIVHRIYCPTRKPNRQNIGEIKSRTIGFIQTGLRTDLGIVPGYGLTFVETHPSVAA